ncbi:MAG: bifunctional diaminohydroxyphosphoribosylaminopyrimidine deaminase/5-amino-6-(5-phosphoribosylamino)uracil reductase RibD [Endomicrobiaceae bacterium]|nr:bifunctional diaminohydroxyphosphoribosylaminopyrimidine deaminase/5-amino-6-(5-phosphoribosylamino)uracil reductase RibD [Endomicrobiaceae bacterium]MDD3052943.1 bifunctional diaminohydroxyphosphoribosylaminopyrimidine deaminase/5-amino-6-(5-phosphoribosylamino)uracil reductase RibD [Endomicrobiaceae bacterium]MDD3922006.1 bifunctional diaminohydroxyphosphoribosylaminopyrimidine deaminase/5-amino-6-(5-phosphoribosylamino)uracil reductase RibD [Endomicrobiaceae bacterium]MDD5102195.1 bifuncti
MQEHKKFMQLALDLAKKGQGYVYPNPMVGCILVKNHKVISRGYHKFFGAEHAEAQAIRNAGDKAKGSTLYVNLEPCNNWGKCPPCVDLIIKSQIKKVVCSMIDPNSHASGKSFKKLKDNGIEVINGVLEKKSINLNKEYVNHIKKVKAYITIKTAVSLDGKIATSKGDSKWITNEKSRNFVHQIRTQYDAILVGTNTVLKDNPVLSSHNKGKNPIRVILDEKLKTPVNYNIINSKIPTMIFYDENLKNIPEYFLKDFVKLIPVDFKIVKKDFNVIIDKLHNMSLKRIVVEGGGEINASVLKTGKVNEIMLFIAPLIVGGRNAKTFVEGDGNDCITDSLKLKKITIKRFGNDILLTGKI